MSHVSASKTLTVEELEAGRINRHENAFRCPTACSHSHYKGIRTVRVCHATSAITVQSPLAREANRERGRGRGVSLPTQHTTNTHQPTQRPNDPSTHRPKKSPRCNQRGDFIGYLPPLGPGMGGAFGSTPGIRAGAAVFSFGEVGVGSPQPVIANTASTTSKAKGILRFIC